MIDGLPTITVEDWIKYGSRAERDRLKPRRTMIHTIKVMDLHIERNADLAEVSYQAAMRHGVCYDRGQAHVITRQRQLRARRARR